MSSAAVTRSQAILCLPVESVNAELVLHDGERAAVMLFVAGGEDLTRLFSGKPFVPVVRGGRVCLVARDAIACVAVPAPAAAAAGSDASADGLPWERQRVAVKLRSGALVEGEVRWVPPPGLARRRTTDGLNLDAPYFAVHAGPTTYLVAKAHVATISEV